jgi:hypothetical protein
MLSWKTSPNKLQGELFVLFVYQKVTPYTGHLHVNFPRPLAMRKVPGLTSPRFVRTTSYIARKIRGDSARTACGISYQRWLSSGHLEVILVRTASDVTCPDN